MTLSKTAPRAKRRWGLLVALVAALMLALAAVASATAPEASGFFELDKNAIDNTTVSHLGVLKSSVKNATTTSIVVCERTPTLPFDPALPPAVGTHILIDAEEMVITAVSAPSSQTGGCSFTDPNDEVTDVRTYTVTRGANSSSAATHPSGADISTLISETKAGVDWSNVYSEFTNPANAAKDNPCDAITDSVACTWLNDPPGQSAFTGGSSDILDLPGWTWTDMSVPDADEILHAYAAKFQGTDQFLFFGADRYAVNGAKDMGFWFFQSPVHAAADGTFVDDEGNPAVHQLGDVLLLGTFTQGGSVSNIRVYKWVGSGGSDGSLDSGGAFGDCVPGGSANGCDTVNSTTIRSPWAYQGKGSTAAANVIYGGGFMEGGIDLTALGLEGCFSSFMAETRSSPSLTAAQKDFTLGRFESCSTDVTTTPADGGGTALADTNDNNVPDIEIGTGSAGVDVTDKAVIDVKGTDTWSGTLDFYLCGPLASGTCDSGGVKVDSQSVDQGTGEPITSASANLTEIGTYCWRGEFTSDTNGVPDGSDASAGECFEVLPVTPTLTTQTVDASGADVIDESVPFGTALYDKATLGGTANEPGGDGGKGIDGVQTSYTSINATDGAVADGSITFTLVGPDTDVTVCDTGTPSAGTGDNPESADVQGDDDYFTSGFTPDNPGDFHWVASYSGSTSGNTTSADHNTACDESGEDVTVQQLQPTMDTAQSFIPNDSATVTVAGGAGDLDGDVTFYLWVDDATCGGGDLTSADHVFGPVTIHADDAAGSIFDSAASGNTTYSYTGNHTFHWIVTFESANAAHLDVTSGCGNEHSSTTISDGVTQPAS